MAQEDYAEVYYGSGEWFSVTDEDIDCTSDRICDGRQEILKQRKKELTYKVCENLLENHWQKAMDTVIQDMLNPVDSNGRLRIDLSNMIEYPLGSEQEGD